MSFVLLGILNAQAAGATAISYFFSFISGTNLDFVPRRIRKIAGGDFAVASEMNDSPDFPGITIFDSSGTVTTANSFDYGNDMDPRGFAIDGSSHYVGWYDRTTNDEGIIYKATNSGILQWAKTYLNAEAIELVVRNLNLYDGYLYATGEAYTNSGSPHAGLVMKIDPSDGSVIWATSVYDSSESLEVNNLAFDSNGNLFLTTPFVIANTNRRSYVVKLDSSGNIVAQREVSQGQFTAIAVLSDDSVVLQGSYYDGSDFSQTVMKMTNDLSTVSWCKTLSEDSGDNAQLSYDRALAVDSQDNIYTGSYVRNFDSNDPIYEDESLYFVKLDSSGSVVLSRYMGSEYQERPTSDFLEIDDNDNLLITSPHNPPNTPDDDLFVGRIPSDGSLTGTYSIGGENWYYINGFVGTSNHSITNSTASNTISSETITVADDSLTSNSITVNQEIVELG